MLELYQVHAVTEGTDAQAEVSVRLAEDGRSVTAKGADPDTLVASAKAYLGALNKLLVRRSRGNGEVVVGQKRIHSTDVGCCHPAKRSGVHAGLVPAIYAWRSCSQVADRWIRLLAGMTAGHDRRS